MSSDFSVVAMIAAYNEADVIEHVVGDLVNQGIQVYFLDDRSTDATVAIVERYLGRGVLAIESLSTPKGDVDRNNFGWERILLKKAALAKELDASWFIHHDADEFRESPWAQLSLKEAIRRVDALGFNAIDFTSLNFWPVNGEFRAGDDVREAFSFYSPHAPYDRVQIRCWKKTNEPVDLVSSGGHEALFEGRRVFPVRFILRHYPIRGQAHGERKVFHERRERFPERERARGWHVQYDGLREGASFIRNPSTLIAYDSDDVRIGVTLQHREVEALEAKLGEARCDIEALRRTLDARAQEVDRATEELARTRTDLDARAAEVVELRGAFDARGVELGAARALLEARVVELEARSVETAALREAFDKRGIELGDARASLDARTVTLEAQRLETAALRDALDKRGVELGDARASLDARTATLEAQRLETAAFRDAFDNRGVELGETRLQLAARTAESSARIVEIGELRDAVEKRAAEIGRLLADVRHVVRQVDEIHASRSWRWTAPARAVYRLLTGQ